MASDINAMTSIHSHGHEQRSYLGEESAKPVLAWLNSHRPQNDPVEQLTLLFAAARTSPAEFLSSFRKIRSVIQKLHLKFRPTIDTLKVEVISKPDGYIKRSDFGPLMRRGGWSFIWQPISTKNMRKAQSLALVALLKLAEDGLAYRVRRCEFPGCGIWFWARFEHQRFHNKTCQDNAYHASPEWKARRAQQMRKSRQEERERELRLRQLRKQRG